jgi:hypothetical protein
MIPDEIPPRRTEVEAPCGELDAANDDDGMGSTKIDPRILVIARAVGRQLAREQLGNRQAANDNTPEVEC